MAERRVRAAAEEEECPRPHSAFSLFVTQRKREVKERRGFDYRKAWAKLPPTIQGFYVQQSLMQRAAYRRAKPWTKKTVMGWVCEDVGGYVASFGPPPRWEDYATRLETEGIDGKTLTRVELSHLTNLGFARIHARLMLKAVRRLVNEQREADNDKKSKGGAKKRGKNSSLPAVCAYCRTKHKTTDSLKRCGGCLAVHYCSRECQVAHWKTHKTFCKQAKQKGERSAKGRAT